jgi:hypothetical protein
MALSWCRRSAAAVVLPAASWRSATTRSMRAFCAWRAATVCVSATAASCNRRQAPVSELLREWDAVLRGYCELHNN